MYGVRYVYICIYSSLYTDARITAVLFGSNVIHIQYVRSQICVYTSMYTYSSLYRYAGRVKEKKKLGGYCMRRTRKIFRVLFWANTHSRTASA